MALEQVIELKYDRFRLSDDEFYDFCHQNDNLTFERDADGNISIMSNTGGITGNLNSELNYELVSWNRTHKLGKVFDSSTTFRLPNSAVRSADVAWVSNEKWNELTIEQKTKFPPVCPDFVIELMSSSDTLKEAKRKMETDWMQNGCRLGWLINPKNQEIFIYRQDKKFQLINDFTKVISGENVLPEFSLPLALILENT